MKKIVIVLPTYNEKDNITKLIEEIFIQEKFLSDYQFEVLISDSHSPDGTGKTVEQIAQNNPRVHYLDVEKRGLGTGYWMGFQYAAQKLGADIIVGMDADFSHDPKYLPSIVQKLESEGYDFITGSRYIKDGGVSGWAWHRRVLSAVANWIMRLVAGIKIHEITTSYRAFYPSLLNKLANTSVAQETSWVFAPLFICETLKIGQKVGEVPIIFTERRAGRSKMNTVNYVFDLLAYAAQFRLQKMGVNLPLLRWARKTKTFIKFGIVGFTGTMVDFFFYVFFIQVFGVPPATSKAFSTEIAIINNFSWNNIWTFRLRNPKEPLWKKFITFNFISLGGLAIGVLIIKWLTLSFGNEHYKLFFFFTIPPVMIWNFFMNHFITWKKPPQITKDKG